jgi:S1-C subfamily serine protease
MRAQSALSIAPSLLRLTAVVFLLFLPASPAHAQFSDVIVARDALILRAPGSQIGVSTRDRLSLETRDAAGVSSRRFVSPNVVVIDQVRANSPASRAGLMKGDVVTVFDGQRVLNANQFSRLVEETPPGWTVKMTIVRDGKVRELSITPTL